MAREKEPSKISRRDFLKFMLASGAATLLGGCGFPEESGNSQNPAEQEKKPLKPQLGIELERLVENYKKITFGLSSSARENLETIYLLPLSNELLRVTAEEGLNNRDSALLDGKATGAMNWGTEIRIWGGKVKISTLNPNRSIKGEALGIVERKKEEKTELWFVYAVQEDGKEEIRSFCLRQGEDEYVSGYNELLRKSLALNAEKGIVDVSKGAQADKELQEQYGPEQFNLMLKEIEQINSLSQSQQ